MKRSWMRDGQIRSTCLDGRLTRVRTARRECGEKRSGRWRMYLLMNYRWVKCLWRDRRLNEEENSGIALKNEKLKNWLVRGSVEGHFSTGKLMGICWGVVRRYGTVRFVRTVQSVRSGRGRLVRASSRGTVPAGWWESRMGWRGRVDWMDWMDWLDWMDDIDERSCNTARGGVPCSVGTSGAHGGSDETLRRWDAEMLRCWDAETLRRLSNQNSFRLNRVSSSALPPPLRHTPSPHHGIGERRDFSWTNCSHCSTAPERHCTEYHTYRVNTATPVRYSTGNTVHTVLTHRMWGVCSSSGPNSAGFGWEYEQRSAEEFLVRWLMIPLEHMVILPYQ
jgi:hypothetical protein